MTSVRYLGEVVQRLVQVGVHACRRLVGDLDGVLQDALRDDVSLGRGRGLSTDKHPEVLVASLCLLLQTFLQGAEPASHQVDVLPGRRAGNRTGAVRVKEELHYSISIE